MSIADKMRPSPVPSEIQVKLLAEKCGDLMQWFKEVQALYYEATGVWFIPDGYGTTGAKVTPQDNCWLEEVGIAPVEDLR